MKLLKQRQVIQLIYIL